jgi:hypothetical protein
LKYSLIALWFCGALVTSYLLLTRHVHALYPWFALSSLSIGAGAAYWGWASTQEGLLQWDGADWWVEPINGAVVSASQAVDNLSVQLDFQFFLLLRLDFAGGRSRSLWLDSWSRRLDWTALRRAVFSPKPSSEAADSVVVPGESALSAGGKA